MIETSGPQSKALQRVCIRCGDANVVSLNCCVGCGFDLTSDLQRDYDLYRGSIPIDAPTGVGERASGRSRTPTEPGSGGANWRPFREQSAAAEEPAKATMDLGAAVLAAVFDGAPESAKATLDIAALGPFLLEGAELEMPDPVAWSPSSAMHVEPAVIVGEATEPTVEINIEEPAAATAHVVGAVHDWVGMESFEEAPNDAISRPVLAKTGRGTNAATSGPVTANRTPPVTPLTRPQFPQARVNEPISKRNHIKDGATTYIDAMQSGFQRPLGWWRHEAVIPLVVAASVATLLVFALM